MVSEGFLKMKIKMKTTINSDIVIINDNNLNFLGGERESQLIIINGVSKKYSLAVIQPGEFKDEINNVNFYWCTKLLRIKHLVKNPFGFIIYMFRVSRLIRQICPKVIHSNSQVSFFIVSLLKRFQFISKEIIILHTDRGLYTKYNRFFRWVFQFSFKFLDTLITTTTFNALSWENANEKKKIYIKYTVIENTAGPIYESIDEKKKANKPYITVGFAGRMCDWKGWPLAEAICAETSQISPEIHYKMYVSCFDKAAENETQNMFNRLARLYGDRFEGRINVPFVEIEQFYYDIDIYILTSWPKTESFGRTIVEAMSRRNAILTTDAGGAVEVVNDPTTICKRASEFACMIKKWSDDRDLLSRVKARNLERVRKEYNLNNNLSKYIKLYEEKINLR